jgi:hypothetical protein
MDGCPSRPVGHRQRRSIHWEPGQRPRVLEQEFIGAESATHFRHAFGHQEEYRELPHKHGIDFDERYVWG